jgi:tRNA(fMet)-specific endonuclease VapC
LKLILVNAFSSFAGAIRIYRRSSRTRIHQSRFRARYQRWLHANLSLFDLLAVGVETARGYAELRRELKTAGTPIPSNDTWIAALAREHRLPVVTRDVHFQAIRGLHLLTW